MSAERSYNAYIDESGDDGFKNLGGRARGETGASSEWMILAGVLVHAEYDRERVQVVDRLRELVNRPGPKPLHWRDLGNDHTRKRLAVRELAAQPLIFCIVALWKPAIEEYAAPGLRKKGYLYNYGARFLIERLSWFAAPSRRQVNLMFEHRSSTSYVDLEKYMRDVQADPDCSIEPDTIANVQPVAPNRKGAQIADFYASAIAEALEPDPNNFLEEEYLLSLRHQLFRRPGRSVLKDGFKVFPPSAADPTRYPWLTDPFWGLSS